MQKLLNEEGSPMKSDIDDDYDDRYQNLLKMQEKYEKKFKFNECEYDDNFITILLESLSKVDQTGDMTSGEGGIMRFFTFKSVCKLLLYMTYNKDLEPCSLKTQHLEALLSAYKKSIENIKIVMNTNMAEIVPEVIEEEFDNFKQINLADKQLDTIDRLMENPLIMLPTINER